VLQVVHRMFCVARRVVTFHLVPRVFQVRVLSGFRAFLDVVFRVLLGVVFQCPLVSLRRFPVMTLSPTALDALDMFLVKYMPPLRPLSSLRTFHVTAGGTLAPRFDRSSHPIPICVFGDNSA
jgi:hypothetical protein